MTARRAVTYRRKIRSATYWRWTTPTGDPCAIERVNGERTVVTICDGKPVQFDHRHQLALDGADDDENLAPLSPDDHKAKTRRDAAARGKVRRLSGQNKTKPKRKIQSRGFDKTRTRKFSGEVVPR